MSWGTCEYLLVFLLLSFLEIHENVIVSPSIYKIDFIDLMAARERVQTAVRVNTKGFTEAVSENAEINVKYLSFCLLLLKAFDSLCLAMLVPYVLIVVLRTGIVQKRQTSKLSLPRTYNVRGRRHHVHLLNCAWAVYCRVTC